jgi:hypothetical protein
VHSAVDGAGASVAALSSTKAIFVYATPNGANDVRAVILNISGTTITTPGAELSLGFDGNSDQIDIVAVSSSAAICVVQDNTSSNDGVALYLTVSGNTITNESNVTFDSGAIDVPRVAFVSSTKAVVAYRESGTSTVKAAILSVSGTTISTGSAITIDSPDNCTTPSVAKISSSAVLLTYFNSTDGDKKAVVLSISGTTLTENSAIVVENTGISRGSLAAYTAAKFAYSYRATAVNINVAELTVSGTTVTADAPILQNSGSGNFSMSSTAFGASLAINVHKGSTNGILLTLGSSLDLAAMTKPASIDAAGEFIYVALLDSGTPILTKISTALNADGTTVFNPGAGDNIGVECGRFSSDTIWVAGNFDGTNVIEKSEDGGSTFVVKDDATIGDVRAFVMGPDSDLKLLVFDETNGDILETINNGETWTNINASVTPEINAIARLGENTQETVFGNDGAANDNLNYSVNSGNNLEDFNLPVNQNVTKVIVN